MGLGEASSVILVYATIVTVIFTFSDVLLSYLLIKMARMKSKSGSVSVSNMESIEVPDHLLPTITILLPMYREEVTISHLLKSIANSNYPKHKLDIRLLVEADDHATLKAITSLPRRAHQIDGILYDRFGIPKELKGWYGLNATIDYVYSHNNGLRTKPNALNIGLRNARGKITTIYDAEDRPDPKQLRKVAVFMLKHPEVACVQARLKYYNSNQNAITRLFSIEYIQQFSLLLPLFYFINRTILLGGSSNFVRTDILREVMKGWDPKNVTEDADLAIRLSKKGLKITPIDSITWEEAPPRIHIWVKQRIRWHKGFLYTLAVHYKNPSRLARHIGLRSTIFLFHTLFAPVIFAISVPGWIIFFVFWIDWSGVVSLDPLSDWIQEAYFYAPAVFYLSLFTLAFSVPYHIVIAFEALFREGDEYALQLAKYIPLIPFYTVLQNISAIVAIFEFFLNPKLWHKTPHGFFVDKR